MWNAGLDEAQAGIKIARRNTNDLRYADDTTLMVEKNKNSLDESERGVKNVSLKLNIQKTVMASGPITSWQMDGETMETVTDLISLGSKITADGDCSHEIKRQFAPWEKSYDQPRQLIKKQRYTLPTKVHLVRAIVFPVVIVWMWELDYKEGWEPKNWCFWPVVLEKTLESPLDCKEIKPVHPKAISLEYSLEELMLKLKLQYFSHLMGRSDSLENILERLKAGAEGDDKGWGGWMASPTRWTWVWVSSGSWWWTGKPGMLQSMGFQRVRHNWVTQLNWIEPI